MALTVVAAPTASAAERNLVAFGDSLLADPSADIYLSTRVTSSTANGANCPSGNNYAKRTGAKLGLRVRDHSCAGAASAVLATWLRHLSKNGTPRDDRAGGAYA